MDEQRIPNQSANQEQAEGSRETLDAGNDRAGEERDRFEDRDTPRGERDENAAGIINRPLDEEIGEQRELPPRGDVKVPGRDHA